MALMSIFYSSIPLTVHALLLFLLGLTILNPSVNAQQQEKEAEVIRVHYGYFPEARPTHTACARGWLNLNLGNVIYSVTCYPQTSGNYIVARLDNSQLHISQLGSTPMAQAAARGIYIQIIHIDHYKGESQGIYVRPSEDDDYVQVSTPYDLVGRTIAVPFGSTIHYQLLYMLNVFGIDGKVKILNMSPSEIMDAWDRNQIDGAACWGAAREYILNGPKPGKILFTSGVLATWGSQTFNVLAANRKFAEEHQDFMIHFMAVISRISDSYAYRLGEVSLQDQIRWDSNRQAKEGSYVPSMADALMNPFQVAKFPDQDFINNQRQLLDLYDVLTSEEQLTCMYLQNGCSQPTLQHMGIYDTAKFLRDQKMISSLGPLEQLGDDEDCRNPETVCGGSLITDTYLKIGSEGCSLDNMECYPMGSYFGQFANSSDFLDKMEALDEATQASPFPEHEIGRFEKGDSDFDEHMRIEIPPDERITIGDGANSSDGKSYTDNKRWTREIRSDDCLRIYSLCEKIIRLDFDFEIRLWSGDFLRIYAAADKNCSPDNEDKTLLSQISGFYEPGELPSIESKGCLIIEFETDSNPEKSYGDNENRGDGYKLSAWTHTGCDSINDCNEKLCNSTTNMCECEGNSWGADCSFTDHCIGTNKIEISVDELKTLESARNVDVSSFADLENSMTYPNDLDCTYEIQVVGTDPNMELVFAKVELHYDLEDTFDMLDFREGWGDSIPYVTLTGKSDGAEIYYIPTDEYGRASLHLTTDSFGRRGGFKALITVESFSSEDQLCQDGFSGFRCKIPYCITNNELGVEGLSATKDYDKNYVLGRIISQSYELNVRAMPWAPLGGCNWSLEDEEVIDRLNGIRIIFNTDLSLEPHSSSSVGDKVTVYIGSKEYILFVEQCKSDEECSDSMLQTGSCKEGICEVQKVIEINTTTLKDSKVSLTTDRNDNGVFYTGIDAEIVLVKECPAEKGSTKCESQGNCINGFCLCDGNIPCSCQCDASVEGNKRVGLAVATVLLLFLLGFAVFLWYRRKKILASREKRGVIEAKEAEIEAFRNSIVGVRSAIEDYLPRLVESDGTERPLPTLRGTVRIEAPEPRVIWCWQETSHLIRNHEPATIVGDPADGFIKYNSRSNEILESAFQNNMNGGLGTFSPLPGYVVDFRTMIQTKEATGFRRRVQRIVETPILEEAISQREVDLSSIRIGTILPRDIQYEPQMVLITGDIVQISTQRQDGWAFGTKLHHEDEVMARQLVQVAMDQSVDTEQQALVDTGWFPLECTEVPSSDALASLQTKVGNAKELGPPSYWDDVKDPSCFELHRVRRGSDEYDAVVRCFKSTSKKVRIKKIHRIQNLSMWQSYVVKRQTMCYRETKNKPENQSVENALQVAMGRFERRWLWHGTSEGGKDKIMQQGFNRSFCGRENALYGKGVYFSRDAGIMTEHEWAAKNPEGRQYIFACRVAVGEYCLGRRDALTPDVRDPATQSLYDSTVGLESGDILANPSFYVTYHDAQAYPEYLFEIE